ncbi:MAG: hypothetical protein IKK93_07710 [Campylobacter sp.]|nr:hypothetical protein [Campylobacter sp.]MBR6612103.1 hypothetical protein [Campylobacter sp.]
MASAWERYEILKNIDDIKTYIKELLIFIYKCEFKTIIYLFIEPKFDLIRLNFKAKFLS